MFYVVRHYEDWSDNLLDYYDKVVYMHSSKDACEEFVRNVDDAHPYVDDQGFCEMYEISYNIHEEVPGMLWTDDPYGHKGRIVEYDINGNPLGVAFLSYDYCHCSDETTAEIKAVIEASKE